MKAVYTYVYVSKELCLNIVSRFQFPTQSEQ